MYLECLCSFAEVAAVFSPAREYFLLWDGKDSELVIAAVLVCFLVSLVTILFLLHYQSWNDHVHLRYTD